MGSFLYNYHYLVNYDNDSREAHLPSPSLFAPSLFINHLSRTPPRIRSKQSNRSPLELNLNLQKCQSLECLKSRCLIVAAAHRTTHSLALIPTIFMQVGRLPSHFFDHGIGRGDSKSTFEKIEYALRMFCKCPLGAAVWWCGLAPSHHTTPHHSAE